MRFSPQQEQALKDVNRWLRDSDQQLYRLFGYAGTGKTTLAMHLAESCTNPLFAAYTGKAALVLREKGCPGAQTLHKLIYVPAFKSKARLEQLEARRDALAAAGRLAELEEVSDLIEQEKLNLGRPMFNINYESELLQSDLLVVDECSMVDAQMAEDILSFGVKVLVLGDPAQLPPVGGEGAFTNATPDTMLTEIHRQAEESPIIRLATMAREGLSLPAGFSDGGCDIWASGTKSQYFRSDLMAADQILVGRNKTRHAINTKMRAALGREGLPVPGDRMVCLKNNHKIGLLNGQIWQVVAPAEMGDRTYLAQMHPEDDERAVQKIEVWAEEPEWYETSEAEKFDFGYALTCHKAQGSQWDHVFVYDESRAFRADGKRWLYTAITRAAKKLTVLKMP
jgi:exodeoxyribonuclease-5